MGQFVKLDIPQAIKKLPIINEAAVYNARHNLIDMQTVKLDGYDTYSSYHFRLVPNQLLGPHLAANVLYMPSVDIHSACSSYKNDTIAFHAMALDAKDESKMKFIAAGGAALLATGFAAVAAVKGNSLLDLSICKQESHPLTKTACIQQVSQHSSADLQYDAAIGVGGAIILGVLACVAFKRACVQSVEAKADFVKAALCQGNAELCFKALNNDQGNRVFTSLAEPH